MLQPGIENLLDAPELGLPGGSYVIETRVHVGAQVVDAGIQPTVDFAKPAA